jgi:hypothetical protein
MRHRGLGRALRAVCSLGLSTGVLLAGMPSASADDAAPNPNRYTLKATGDGMLVEVWEPSLPATDKVASSAYAASASVNSSGNSSAFAGLPYLGAFAQTLPALVSGLSGGSTPPLPPAPGYVESRYPNVPSGKQSQGPYLIKADSGETSSQAQAGFGLSPEAASSGQQVYATASVVARPDGSTLSTSTAGVRGLALGPLRILEFGSTESIEESGKEGDQPKILSSTKLGTIQVLGFTLGVDQDGFHVLGAPIGTPLTDVMSKVNQVLGQRGMEVTVLPGSTVKDAESGLLTVLSAALRITVVEDVPAQGLSKVILTIGRASVGSVDESTGGITLPVDLPLAAGDAAPAPATATVEPPTAVATSPLVPVGDLPGAPTDVPAPVAQPLTPELSAPLLAAGPPRTLGFLPAADPLRGSGTSSTYLVLALAGAVLVVGQQLFSRFGIHLLMRLR